jgi:hypothetical protein
MGRHLRASRLTLVRRCAEVAAWPADDGVGVAIVPLAVLVLDQDVGCLDAVVERLALAESSSPREGRIDARDSRALSAGQVRGQAV